MSDRASGERVDAVIAELAQAAARGDAAPEASAAPRRRATERRAELPPAPVVAVFTSLVFAALTVYNLSAFWSQRELPTPSPEAAKADLAALATVESSLLQTHYETHGTYPQDPAAAGLETEGLHYVRLSPHEFEMTLESDGVAVTLDSRELARQAQTEEIDAEEDWQ